MSASIQEIPDDVVAAWEAESADGTTTYSLQEWVDLGHARSIAPELYQLNDGYVYSGYGGGLDAWYGEFCHRTAESLCSYSDDFEVHYRDAWWLAPRIADVFVADDLYPPVEGHGYYYEKLEAAQKHVNLEGHPYRRHYYPGYRRRGHYYPFPAPAYRDFWSVHGYPYEDWTFVRRCVDHVCVYMRDYIYNADPVALERYLMRCDLTRYIQVQKTNKSTDRRPPAENPETRNRDRIEPEEYQPSAPDADDFRDEEFEDGEDMFTAMPALEPISAEELADDAAVESLTESVQGLLRKPLEALTEMPALEPLEELADTTVQRFLSLLEQYEALAPIPAGTSPGGTYTVFAPTDAALDADCCEKLRTDQDALNAFVCRHVSDGNYPRRDATTGEWHYRMMDGATEHHIASDKTLNGEHRPAAESFLHDGRRFMVVPYATKL